MKTKSELIRLWPKDPNMRELISSLWRDLPVLYSEKAEGEIVRNKFLYDVEFAQALGQDHLLAGNQSTALGIGHKTTSYREILLGAYATEKAGTYDSWVETDRLIGIGNGLDGDNRHDALNMYKSGYAQLNNALRLGAFSWGANLPESGALQYTAVDGFRAYKNSLWNKFAFLNSDVEDQKLTYFDSITGNLKTSAITKAVLENHLGDVSTYSAKSVTTAAGQILSAFTSDAKGHVNGISLRSLVAGDIPGLEISKINGLQTALDGKSPTHTHPYLSDSDSRIAQWSTAYSWGNHAGLYSLLGHGHTIADVAGLQTSLDGKVQLSPTNRQNGDVWVGTISLGSNNPLYRLQWNETGKTGFLDFITDGIAIGSSDSKVVLYAGGSIRQTIASSGEATFTSTVSATQLQSTTTIAAPLTVASSTMVSNLNSDLLDGKHASEFITGTGTAGYLPVFTGAGSLGNSPVYSDGINVGIGYSAGTEIDNNKLAVNGSGYFNGGIISTSGINSTGYLLNNNNIFSSLSSGYLPYWDGTKFLNSKMQYDGNFFTINNQDGGVARLCFIGSHSGRIDYKLENGIPDIANGGFSLYDNTNSRLSWYITSENNFVLPNLAGTGTRLTTASATGQLGSLSYSDFISNNSVVTGTGTAGYIPVFTGNGTLGDSPFRKLDAYNWGLGDTVYGFFCNNYRSLSNGSDLNVHAGMSAGINLLTANYSRLYIDAAGYITASSLAGTGTRLVTTSSTGQLGVVTGTGFVKSDGTVDSNSYSLSTHNHAGTYQPLGNYVLTTDSRLSDSRQASDVYSWAKASTKPNYTYSEVGAAPSSTVSFPGYYSSGGDFGTEYYAARYDHAHGQYLTGITSALVTNALGFTPYSSANPSGYITSSALSSYANSSWVTANFVAKAYEGKVRTSVNANMAYLNSSDFLYNIASDTILIAKTDYAQQGNDACITSGGAYTALSAKQASLVSGTNIRTINGTSLLGSGDITIASSTVWGSITGSLANQTDLVNALATKAAKNGSASEDFLTSSLILGTAWNTGWMIQGSGSTMSFFQNGSTKMTFGSDGIINAYDFALASSSDIRLKRNVSSIQRNLDAVSLVQFNFNSDRTNRTRYGVIAQQLEAVAPEMVYTDKNGMKSVNYTDLLIAKVANLEEKIKKLEKQLCQSQTTGVSR